MMDLWFTEKQTPSFGITAKIKQTYVSEKTDFQDLAMIETEEFGNMLVLDGMVMTTVKDEFVYHEMVAHPALNTHPNPKKFWLWAVAMAALFVRLSSTLKWRRLYWLRSTVR